MRAPGSTHSLALVAVAAATLAVAGCGSSKSTSPASAAFAQAQVLDSLAQQAVALGQFDRARLLSYPTAVLAEGITPTPVTVTVNGSSQHFEAVAADIIQTAAGSTSATPTDSDFVIAAWEGSDVTSLIYFQIAAPDTINDAAVLTDTLANVNLTGGAATAALTTSGGTCSLLDLVTAAALLQGATCTHATITSGFNVTYSPITGAPDSIFVMGSQKIAGIRLVLPASTGGQNRVAPLRHIDQRLSAAR
jgi:hypothetical protein